MNYKDTGSFNNVPIHRGVGHSNPLPPLPPIGEISERVHFLQMEFADCTLQLGRVKVKHNRLLVQKAHYVKEIAQLRASLGNQR